ncbi:hypothetical protein DPMN_064136 [Dreissena polymorpha]|uniref:Uncharacterized protein n=1 Tax=Dreissena polymorpha TaxID=45954 RepID=A0A9D4HJT6_DREPO|nr:hypothetical protein DPMN_064136 [Dreissena polymorpha]
MKILPSTFNNDIVRNCPISLETSSFGTKMPSARCHSTGTSPLRQTTFNSFHNRLSSFGHDLYTL